MFDSVLNRAHLPKRQIGTGAAFAIAFHMWLLIGAIWLSSRPHQDKKQAVDVTFVAALPPPPPPPPPPPGGGVKPKETKPVQKKPEVDPDIYKDSKEEKKPEEKKEEKKEDEPQAGGQEGGVDGGVAGGVVGGVVGGVIGGVLGGTLGGTGTGPVPSTPAPTFGQINMGEGTDQPAPVWLGSPQAPYPQEARTAKQEGLVLARCNVYPDGSLQGCKIVKSHPFFDAAVLAHLGKLRAKPFTSGGKPVSGYVPVNISMRFKLEQ
jgi:protein TonB